jgi:hypothetical protein
MQYSRIQPAWLPELYRQIGEALRPLPLPAE